MKQIGRLEIAVDNAAVVSVLEGRSDLASEIQHLAPRQTAALFEYRVETRPVHVFHGKPGPAFAHTRLEEAHDIWMVEPPQDVNFALEAKDEALFGGQLRGEHLDGGDGRLTLRRRIRVSKIIP